MRPLPTYTHVCLSGTVLETIMRNASSYFIVLECIRQFSLQQVVVQKQASPAPPELFPVLPWYLASEQIVSQIYITQVLICYQIHGQMPMNPIPLRLKHL